MALLTPPKLALRDEDIALLVPNEGISPHNPHPRGLTRSDKTQLENFYIERILAPEIRKVLPGATNGLAPSLRLMTAKDLEVLVQIDRKTLYHYVKRNLTPHIRIKSNVRFVEGNIRRWLERHTVRSRTRKRSKTAS